MPVRNEASYIVRSLDAVFAQDYPDDRLEVIVADGMSTDGTRARVESEQSRRPSLRLVDNPRRTAPAGLNAALRVARGEIVIRVDGHCEIASDYVKRCVSHLSSGGADAVGGPITTVGENRLAEAIAAAMSSAFGVGGSAFRTIQGKTLFVDSVAFPAYRRDLLERLGPFDEELVRNQDDEYNYRLRKSGGRVLLAADVRSRYYSRGSWRSLWRQYFQYGFWKVRVLQKHPRQMNLRQFAPAAFVAVLLAAAAAAFFSPIGLWGLVLLLGAYVGANLGAAFIAARRYGMRLFPLLPPAFAILHMAYGLGFWTGLVRFWNRWGSSKVVRVGGAQNVAAPEARPADSVGRR